jgi:hypothetical protein
MLRSPRPNPPASNGQGRHLGGQRWPTGDRAGDDRRIYWSGRGPAVRTGDAAVNGTSRRRCLNDCVAAGASQFGPPVADHAEARRHILELLGYVLAKWLECAAAIGAVRCLGLVDLLHSRQMRWEGPSYGSAHIDLRRLQPGQRRLLGQEQFLKLQLELVDLPLQLLRAPAELHAAQLGDQQLERLDLGVAHIESRAPAWTPTHRPRKLARQASP